MKTNKAQHKLVGLDKNKIPNHMIHITININRQQQQRYKAWNKADLKSKVSLFVFSLSQVILVASRRLSVDLKRGQMG